MNNNEIMITTAVVWIVICLIGIIIEVHTAQMFGYNFAIAAAICAILAVTVPTNLWWIQLLVFVIISLLGIIILRPFYLKWIKAKDRLKDGFQLLLNQKITVLKEIDAQLLLIKIGDKEFRAQKPLHYSSTKHYYTAYFKGVTAYLKERED